MIRTSLTVRRRLLVAAMTALLALVFLEATPALAYTRYSCSDTFTRTLLSGRHPSTASSEEAVKAWYLPPSPSQDYRPCGPDSITNNAVLSWVALIPGQSNPDSGDPWAIAQVGLTNCDFFGVSACDGTDALHLFWSVGGCGTTPGVHDLGTATWDHNYSFEVSFIDSPTPGADKVLFFVSGTVRLTLTPADSLWSAISCWVYDERDTAVVAEKKDRGDYFGPVGAGGAHIGAGVFTGMRRLNNGTWYDYVATTCEYTNAETPHPDGCDAQGTTMWVWTQ